MKMHINTFTSWLLIVLSVATACQDEDDPFTACISYDESKTYSVGQKLKLSSCTEGAVSYEWWTSDAVLTGKEVELIIPNGIPSFIVKLTVTDQNQITQSKEIAIAIEDIKNDPNSIIRKNLDGFDAKRARFLTTPQGSILAYGASYQRQFVSYFNSDLTRQTFQTYDFDTLSVIGDRTRVADIFPLPDGGYILPRAISIGKVYDENGNRVRTLNVTKYDKNVQFVSNTEYPIIAGPAQPITVQNDKGFYTAARHSDSVTVLASFDKYGTFNSVNYIKTSLSSNTVLFSFMRNATYGYTMILEDRVSKQLIRLDLDEEGQLIKEYNLPFSNVLDYLACFYADGERLIIGTGEELAFMEGENLKWKKAIDEPLMDILPGEANRYMCISSNATVRIIDESQLLYAVDYNLNQYESIIEMDGFYYLAGVVRNQSYPEDEIHDLYFIKIKPDGGLVAE